MIITTKQELYDAIRVIESVYKHEGASFALRKMLSADDYNIAINVAMCQEDLEQRYKDTLKKYKDFLAHPIWDGEEIEIDEEPDYFKHATRGLPL